MTFRMYKINPSSFVLFVLILTAAAGCAHSIHQVHVSDFDAQNAANGTVVSAQTEQFVILGFKGDTQYVEDAVQQLKSKCEGGAISGIATQYSTSLGFFSWTNKISLKGTCLPGI